MFTCVWSVYYHCQIQFKILFWSDLSLFLKQKAIQSCLFLATIYRAACSGAAWLSTLLFVVLNGGNACTCTFVVEKENPRFQPDQWILERNQMGLYAMWP